MRTMSLTVLAAAVLGLTGCGGGDPDAAMKELIAAIDNLATALESGDIAKIQAAADSFKSVREKHKNTKATEAHAKQLRQKYDGELTSAGTRMRRAQAQAADKMTNDADKKKLEEILASIK